MKKIATTSLLVLLGLSSLGHTMIDVTDSKKKVGIHTGAYGSPKLSPAQFMDAFQSIEATVEELSISYVPPLPTPTPWDFEMPNLKKLFLHFTFHRENLDPDYFVDDQGNEIKRDHDPRNKSWGFTLNSFITFLQHAKSIEELSLSDARNSLPEAFFEALKELPNLKSLNFYKNDFDPQSFAHLKNHLTLEKLVIGKSDGVSQDLVPFLVFPKIKELTIENEGISDDPTEPVFLRESDIEQIRRQNPNATVSAW